MFGVQECWGHANQCILGVCRPLYLPGKEEEALKDLHPEALFDYEFV